MTRQPGTGLAAWGAGLVVVGLLAGCAAAPVRIEQFKPMPVGSTVTNSQTNTGSYGSGTTQVTFTTGRQDWAGQPVLTATSPAGAMLMRPEDGRRMGFLGPNGQLQWTLDPPVGMQYPLEAGRSWVQQSHLTMQPGGQVVPVQSKWQVVGVEEVEVPAGRFKALRVTLEDTMGGKLWNRDTYWLEPERQRVVKSSLERLPAHPAGAGTRQAVLVSVSVPGQ